ncbi:MAG: hypothetical protein QOG97_240 [Acidimicrobiaceae bacterium]|nr:hypothetical protein [Acidimicrobiaceae bacterium]
MPALFGPSGDAVAPTNEPCSTHRAALILGGAAPNAVFLVGLQRVLQTSFSDFAGVAHGFGCPSDAGRDAGAANREEQLRAGEPAIRLVAPKSVKTTDWSGPEAITHSSHGPLDLVGH